MLLSSQELEIGQFVKSRAGRDKGKILVVTGVIDEKHVLVSDGDLRKLNKPKKKKVIHLNKITHIDCELKETLLKQDHINDAYLRNKIKDNWIESN